MKPRRQKLDNLYFRWGRHVNMGSEDCAKALSAAGIIIRDGANHYRESEDPSVQGLSREKFEALVSNALNKYSQGAR
jgi:hypothetical protein